MEIQQSPYQDQLVRGLAHKMNNILTLFHGYVGLLLDNHSLDSVTKANLSKIKEGACAASELMDRTHALVRPSPVVARELDLLYFIGLLRPSMHALCGPETTLDIIIPPNFPNLRTDASRVKSALLELVRNACEATVETGGAIRIEVSRNAPHAPRDRQAGPDQDSVEWISIVVTDNGPGISAEVGSRVFQPFFSTKRRRNAAGLGLNVAAEAVQQLGGLLQHHSAPGETRFEILLPVELEDPTFVLSSSHAEA